MGRGPDTEETKRRKIAKLLGIEYVPDKEPTTEDKEEVVKASREAEAVLDYISRSGQGYIRKECPVCLAIFSTDRRSVGYCSDNCRKVQLQGFGIDWDPNKIGPERWGMTGEPLTLGPTALIIADDVLATQNLIDNNVVV